jgi:hypothetical protein
MLTRLHATICLEADRKESMAKVVEDSKIIVSTKGFFKDVVQDALTSRKVETFPMAQDYLVSILENYIKTDNLFDTQTDNGKLTRETLAEMFLKSQSLNGNAKIELLKKLGDVSLYVSGFFGDSFERKVIDVDYYINMGGTAYGTLAQEIRQDTSRRVFNEFSRKFLEFVDVLTLISQKTFVQNDESILRLYEKFLKTGSELARETLEEKGIVTIPFDKDKKSSAQ